MWETKNFPTPEKQVAVFTKDGKVIQAISKLRGSEIVFENNGKCIDKENIICWNEDMGNAEVVKPCRACGRGR